MESGNRRRQCDIFFIPRMLKTKRFDIALQANKLRNGLSKVEETTALVACMSEELAASQVTFINNY